MWADFSKDLDKDLAVKIVSIWSLTSIPIIHFNSVKRHIKSYIKKYKLISKNNNRANFKNKTDEFKQDAYKLLDIAICKCLNICNCKASEKIPKEFITFINDQRTDRIMKMPLNGNKNDFYGDTKMSDSSLAPVQILCGQRIGQRNTTKRMTTYRRGKNGNIFFFFGHFSRKTFYNERQHWSIFI